MKYRGHPSAKGHAPNCPKCGSWLESTETCGAPVWDKTGRVFIASAIIGLGLSIAFGLPAGLITGALCFAAINLIFRHLNHLGGVFVAGPTSKIVKSKVSRHKPNYAIKPTPELAFRSRRTFRPARLIAALAIISLAIGGPG